MKKKCGVFFFLLSSYSTQLQGNMLQLEKSLVGPCLHLPSLKPHDLLPKDTHHWGGLDHSPEIIIATSSSGQRKRQRRGWKSSEFLPDNSIRKSLRQRELQTTHLPLRHHSPYEGFLAFLSYSWWQLRSFKGWLYVSPSSHPSQSH